jgi:hypothetical protein
MDRSGTIEREELDRLDLTTGRLGHVFDDPLRLGALLEPAARGGNHLEAQLRGGTDDDVLLTKPHCSPPV